MIAEYIKHCRPLYPRKIPFTSLIITGAVIHYLYHIQFQLNAIKMGFVEPEFYQEQFHMRIKKVVEILN